MNLWGRKCSPRPTPPPSWLLPPNVYFLRCLKSFVDSLMTGNILFNCFWRDRPCIKICLGGHSSLNDCMRIIFFPISPMKSKALKNIICSHHLPNILKSTLCVCAQLCPTLFDPIECSPPGSFVHGIFQARS